MGSRLREVWAGGGPAYGTWCVLPAGLSAETLAVSGTDYVCIDCQHGLVGYEGMVHLLHAVSRTGAAPVVRVPLGDWGFLGKALDAGAEAVIVPMVSTPDEAAAAAAACRYPPEGGRSFGPARSGMFLGYDPGTVNREVVCLVMIETREGLEAAEEICAVPGVDGVYVGPADLAIALGLPPGLGSEAPEHRAAVDRIRSACDAAGIVPGIHCGNGAQARARVAEGFRMVTVTSDAGLIAAGARRELAAAKE